MNHLQLNSNSCHIIFQLPFSFTITTPIPTWTSIHPQPSSSLLYLAIPQCTGSKSCLFYNLHNIIYSTPLQSPLRQVTLFSRLRHSNKPMKVIQKYNSSTHPTTQQKDAFYAHLTNTAHSVGNSHRSASPKMTTLEEDWELFVNLSLILCLWF